MLSLLLRASVALLVTILTGRRLEANRADLVSISAALDWDLV